MEALLCKIRDLNQALAAYETNFKAAHGIGLNEGMVLCSLHQSGELTAGALSALLGLSPSNTSKVIASVEKKGYIQRQLHHGDRRQMQFNLSPEGLQLLQHIKQEKTELPEFLKTIVVGAAGLSTKKLK